MTFLDTNVLVYSVDANNADKHARARALIAEATSRPGYLVSAQVLNEFSNVALLKLKLEPEEIRSFLSVFKCMRVIAVEPEWTERALAVKLRYGTQFFDSLLLVAAEAAGCDTILTEDLSDGQVYNGVRAVNPFKAHLLHFLHLYTANF